MSLLLTKSLAKISPALVPRVFNKEPPSFFCQVRHLINCGVNFVYYFSFFSFCGFLPRSLFVSQIDKIDAGAGDGGTSEGMLNNVGCLFVGGGGG